MENMKSISEVLKGIKEEIVKKQEVKKKQEQMEAITKKENNVSVEMNVLELGLIFNPTREELQRKMIKRKIGINKETGEEYYIKMSAPVDEEIGVCRREDLHTLIVCFILYMRAKRQGKVEVGITGRHYFKTTWHQLASLLYDEAGGRVYELVKESTTRLAANFVETNYWYSVIEKKRFKRALFHWISAEYDEDEKKVKIGFDEEEVKNMEEGYVRFLQENKLLDILKFKSDFAKILVLMFLKRHNEDYFEYYVEKILDYLGIRERYDSLPPYRRNFYIKKTIIPAVKEAAEFLGFEVTYGIGKDEEGNIVKDPYKEEKFRFKRKIQSLFAETKDNEKLTEG